MGRLHTGLKFINQIRPGATLVPVRRVFLDDLGLRLCQLVRHIGIG